jgi:hypothetical protein
VPKGVSSARPSHSATASGVAGPDPQLPVTIVVTPCVRKFRISRADAGSGSQSTNEKPMSVWLWRSMKPGATTLPRASISRRARPGAEPTATMRSPRSATSPAPAISKPPV